MSQVKELEIKALNILVKNNILLRLDSFGREVGILVKPEDVEDRENWRAIYVYRKDFPKLIIEMFKFFMEISSTKEITALFTELNNEYVSLMRVKGVEIE